MTNRSRIMAIIEQETGGKSYKSHKYSLDDTERSAIEYGEDTPKITWKKKGETKDHRQRVSLVEKAAEVTQERPLFSYFLDGSRYVYKVDDMDFEMTNRTPIYPIVAGQIGVGCCKRVDKKMFCEKLEREIVIAMPDIAQSERKRVGFLVATAMKLNESSELSRIRGSGWKFETILKYSTKHEGKGYNDKATAKIQEEMMKSEQKMVATLVKERKLNKDNYLIKDGSLEYKATEYKTSKEEGKQKKAREYQKFKNNYTYVVGVSKRFDPEVCHNVSGKPDPGFIADLELYHRTPVASLKTPIFWAM
ncbi:MAG: hypothetical protein FWG64_06670 [Firmicutes bacterium]|nr:hypothetical protein [Bacillota bacterium]